MRTSERSCGVDLPDVAAAIASVKRRPAVDLVRRGSRARKAITAATVSGVIALTVFGSVTTRAHAGEDGRCHPIHYVVNTRVAPPGALVGVEQAMARLHEATGIPVVFEGTTMQVPRRRRAESAFASVLVAWVRPDSFPLFEADPGAYGFADGTWDAHLRLVSGWIYMNADKSLPAGFGSTSSWGAALLHELGHLAGLQHSALRGEVMYPELGGGATRWSAFERMRLAELGSHTGCRAGDASP